MEQEVTIGKYCPVCQRECLKERCQMWRGGPDAGDCAMKFPMRTLGGGGV